MKKTSLLISLFALIHLLPNTAHAAVNLFGYTFDVSAFVDDVTHVSGEIAYYDYSQGGYSLTGDDNIDLDTVLVGYDLLPNIEGAFGTPGDHSTKSAYIIEVFFLDNYLFNGPGADLTVWERGVAERFNMSLWDPVANAWTSGISFPTSHVGSIPNSIDVSPGVSVGEVNFAVWGLPATTQITKARFWSDRGNPNADLTAFGGLNSRPILPAIPEPSSLMLLSLSLAGLFLIERGQSPKTGTG